MKRTLLNDFKIIFNSIECKGLSSTCEKCSNYTICDILEKLISSIKKFY